MKSFSLFSGSNNKTKKLEIEKIQNLLDKYLQGYTIIQADGVWKGLHEKTAVVEITTDQNIIPIIAELKTTLNQDAIAYRFNPTLLFL